jgi:hypothetical protein
MQTRLLAFLFAGAAIVLPLLTFIAQGQFALAGLLVGALFFLQLFRRLDLWWVAAVMSLGSGLYLVNSQATVHLLAVLGFCGLGVAIYVMSQGRSRAPLSLPQQSAVVFAVLLLLTASIRGWGLRVLGSSMWGGMDYVTLLATLLFFIMSSQIILSNQRMWLALKMLCLLALIPAVAILLVQTTSSALLLTRFIDVQAVDMAGIGAAGARLQRLQTPAVWAGIFALMLFGRHFKFTFGVLLMAGLSFIMMGLSGHRSVTVLLGLTVLIYLVLQRRTIHVRHYVVLLAALFISIGLLFVYANRLPIPFQRAIALIPGLQLAEEAVFSAEGTTSWRIEMWRMMLPMISEYLILGRGMAFSLVEAYSAYSLASDWDRYVFFIATHNYHNGPLFLLIDFGLGGLLAGAVIMFTGVVYFYRQRVHLKPGTRWHNMYMVIYCFYTSHVIYFFAVYGDSHHLSRILLVAAVLDVLTRSARQEQTEGAADDALLAVEPNRRARLPVIRPHGALRPGLAFSSSAGSAPRWPR